MNDQEHQIELLRRASSGDEVAVMLLLANDSARLRGSVARRLPADLQSVVDVDDIVQETHVEVFRHIAGFENRGPDSFYRWVATIALRRLRNAIKRHRAQKRGGGNLRVERMQGNLEDSVVALLDLMAGPEKTPSRNVARQEAVNAVRAALHTLPEHYRQAVELVYLDGLTPEDAAQRMGRTRRAVHNLCHKAKRRLEESLGSRSRYISDSFG